MNLHQSATFVPVDMLMHRGPTMSESDHAEKLDELERLLNDPDVIMHPGRVWSLLDEISAQEASTDAA